MEHIGVCIIVLDKDGQKVLLGKRLNSYRSGMLGLPGGRINTDEPLKECGIRELSEETSLITTTLSYCGVVRELQEEHNFIHFAFICQQYSGQVRVTEPDKCESWNWYPLDQLPDTILPGHKAALEIYKNSNTIPIRDLT